MKRILNREHILMVEKEALNSAYRMIGVLSFSVGSKSPLSIVKITPKGLIFIQGTDDTGFTHINQRHSGSLNIEDWENFYDNKGNIIEKEDKFGRKKLRLDNPSSFHPNSIPIFDYLKIADQVYSPNNLNDGNNKNKELFDLYDGIAFGNDGNEVEYRLLTYKNSKIVHTLYPIKKKFNKQEKRVIHFARQNPKSVSGFFNDDFQIEVPYNDEFNIKRYIIIIRNDPKDKSKEKWFIQVNTSNGIPWLTVYFGKREKDFDIYSTEYLRRLEYVDFTPLEKEILKIEKP